MARKKNSAPVVETYREKDVTQELHEDMATYSKAAIQRHIPDVRDGLKPVHRRILYTLYKNGFGSTSKHTKVARVVGATMVYHPHGDSSIDSALTSLSQEWVYNVPLIDIEGNRGAIDGLPPAAGRYIECRLFPEAEMILDGIKQGAVRMDPNYDNSDKEPVVLPAHLPIAFINGVTGMGVGTSTNVAPHNPRELLRAAELVNRKPDVTLGEVMKIVKGPDFPTGGAIINRDAIKKLYQTGSASLPMRATATISGQEIHITEIPYGDKIDSTKVMDSMWACVDKHNLHGRVTDIEDRTEDGKLLLAVKTKRGEDPQVILNIMYRYSILESNFPAKHMVIVDGAPQQVTLIGYLSYFLNFKRELVRNIYTTEVNQKKDRLHIVEGFIRAVSILDKVIKLIRSSSGRADSISGLVDNHKFSEQQATAIVDMRLHRLSNQDIEVLRNEQSELTDRINWLEELLNNDDKFREEISKQLNASADHFTFHKRRTRIDSDAEEIVVEATDLVKDQDVVVVVKPGGAQRMSKTVFMNNKDNYRGTILANVDTSTSRGIVMLTKQGRIIQRLVNDLEHSALKNDVDDIRRSTSTFKSSDEIVNAVVFDIDKADDLGLSVISITAQGQIKHSPLSKSLFAYSQKGYMTRTNTYNGLKLKDDEVVFQGIVKTEDVPQIFVTMKRHNGGRKKTVHFKDIKEQGASGSGTNGIKVTDSSDYVEVINHNLDKYTVTNVA